MTLREFREAEIKDEEMKTSRDITKKKDYLFLKVEITELVLD